MRSSSYFSWVEVWIIREATLADLFSIDRDVPGREDLEANLALLDLHHPHTHIRADQDLLPDESGEDEGAHEGTTICTSGAG